MRRMTFHRYVRCSPGYKRMIDDVGSPIRLSVKKLLPYTPNVIRSAVVVWDAIR